MGASLVNKNLLAEKRFTNVGTHISLLTSLDFLLVGCVVTLTLRMPGPSFYLSIIYCFFSSMNAEKN